MGLPSSAAGLLDPALRRIVAVREAEFRPFDRYGETVPGLTWLPLSPDCAQGHGCFLLRFAPGAESLPHEHCDIEEFLVVEGELVDADGQVLRAGDFVSYAAGSRHASWAPDGALILVVLRAGNRRLPSG